MSNADFWAKRVRLDYPFAHVARTAPESMDAVGCGLVLLRKQEARGVFITTRKIEIRQMMSAILFKSSSTCGRRMEQRKKRGSPDTSKLLGLPSLVQLALDHLVLPR